MYGITDDDIKFIDDKIDFQKKFLENFSVDFGDKSINMLDNTYSANLNPKKYFSEINNRVNTMVENAKEKGLKPVFVTLTAPSQYHKKEDGYLLKDPNDTAKVLTKVWNRFTSLNIFREMKKELGIGLTYFRVYEPHKSGVPHLHALLFLPASYILPVKKKFKQYFSDSSVLGTNKKALDYRYTWYKEKGGAVGYVMKYILKTFQDTNKTSVQHAVYWYIKHRVRRFLSSRTLAPLSVYRKVRYYFKEKYQDDFKKISEMMAKGTIYRSFENSMINYRYYDIESGEIEDIVIWAKNADLLLNAKTKLSEGTFKLEKYIKKEIKKSLKVEIDGLERFVFSESDNKFIEVPIVPSKLSNYSLITYFNKINEDIESVDMAHYGLTKNEMIKRDLLKQDIQSLNDFSDDNKNSFTLDKRFYNQDTGEIQNTDYVRTALIIKDLPKNFYEKKYLYEFNELNVQSYF